MKITKSTYIANDVRHKILVTKELKSDQMLPTEKELCQQYNVSKMTLKKALDALVVEGLISKRRGVGTFVKNVPDSSKNEIADFSCDKNLTGFSNTHKGKSIATKVLEYSIIPCGKELARKLNINPDDFVYNIIRVRYLNGQPMAHEHTYMPIDIIPGLKRQNVEGSIYDYIEYTLQKSIQSSHVTIRAQKGVKSIVDCLGLEVNDPIVQVEQIAFLSTGQIFEYSLSSHRYDAFEFHDVIIKNLP